MREKMPAEAGVLGHPLVQVLQGTVHLVQLGGGEVGWCTNCSAGGGTYGDTWSSPHSSC